MKQSLSNKALPKIIAAIGFIVVILVGVTFGTFLAFTHPATEGKVRAGFVYVGPERDYGWSHAHDIARKSLETRFDWLETVYVESVSEENTFDKIKYLVEEEGVEVVFTTSYAHMNGTYEAAKHYSDVMFFNCAGYKRLPNLGTYFADLYQIYYLNGMMAGALTQSGKLGYVGAFKLPEVMRHLNAFHLGAKAVNSSVTTYVRWLESEWYDPVGARTSAESFISEGVDMLAYTEDSPAVLDVASQFSDVYSFSHYSPMPLVGGTSTLSGQLVNWEIIYEDILLKVHTGVYSSTNLAEVDYFWILKEGAVQMGVDFQVPIQPSEEEELKSIFVQDPVLGNISVRDLIYTRVEQMSESNVVFEPFTGPITDTGGTVRVASGERLNVESLLSINWLVKGIVEV